MTDRRQFFQRSAVAAAMFGIPLTTAEGAFGQDAPGLPKGELFTADPARYWAELRRQWLLAADRINLNCGSVGCTPLPVLRATIDHMLSAEAYRDGGYPWFGYEESRPLRELREALAAFLNCKRDELALVRNATEGCNIVCNGLDMKPGDEILTTDQEHAGGRCCWEQKAARFGVKLKTINLPRPPKSVDEIVDRFDKGITPQTRVIAFSHITSPTGLVLPAKEICDLARRKGILSHIDGAHVIGQMPLDISTIGCDFYATSPHKWLMSPKGTGTLYIREELQERLWVNTASADWRNYKQKAYRFSNIGTSNLSVMVGFKAALDFYKTMGPERIFRRIHELATQVRTGIEKRPQLRIVNANADAFFAGMVSFEAAKGDLSGIERECNMRRIRFAGGKDRIRIATHIFTQPTEIQALFDAIDKA